MTSLLGVCSGVGCGVGSRLTLDKLQGDNGRGELSAILDDDGI